MLTRQAMTVLVGGAALFGAVSAATAVHWMAPRPEAPLGDASIEAGLYPDGTALRRVGAKMILR